MKKQFAFILMMVVVTMLVVSCAPGSTLQINTPVPNPNATAVPGQINVPAVSININAPGPNPLINQPNANGQVAAGALIGLWHGFISPVTMLISFFNPDVQMFEVHNDGSAYNLGFFLGILILMAVAGTLIVSRRG